MFQRLLVLVLAVAPFCTAGAQKLSPLAPEPDWRRLEAYQRTITREDFQNLLDSVYAPGGAYAQSIQIEPDRALITRRHADPFVLEFAQAGQEAPIPRTWHPKAALPLATAKQPLAGLRIAIDPGHLGGDWAKMEERWFKLGKSAPVKEGDLTLRVAKMLVPRLKALGAEVSLTRSKPGPVTAERPKRLKEAAASSLQDKATPITPASLKTETERLFYRASEIRARAKLVNSKLKPDLVLCLHFNAEDWGNQDRPALTDVNHLHLLITGAFSAEELAYDDQRFNMLIKLLSRSYPEEAAAGQKMATAMANRTGLPPYTYHGGKAAQVGDNPYLWARNLLANRLYECPVIYIEPYVMNSREAFARIQAGDYEGLKNVAGKPRPSIFREYADGVVRGLVDYYGKSE